MIGKRLGPYEITAKLGEGGMGEVYRATDTQLERQVAIKVLPSEFTADRDRLARFEREAKLLAQLHHPSIASIFGIAESDGVRALIMELVEGPTLAERLESGALPVDESLSIARQIAEALEEAHEKGIIHRDLKPQNIKASVAGKVKVLDFGLAKAMDPAGTASGAPSASQLAASPTLTLGATVQGVILGTAAYMAPEQAKGFIVDKRADVWSFGVVLYEMLTGISPFVGDSVPDTLARVLQREIDFDSLPASTPTAIRQLLRRCLERNPKNRLHDIADARIVLDDQLAGRLVEVVAREASPESPGSRARGSALLVGAAVVAALGVAVGWLAHRPAPLARAPVSRLSIPMPPEHSYRVQSIPGRSLAISRDGELVAYVAAFGESDRLFVRALGELSPRRIATADEARQPFFSPDGKWIGYFRGNELQKVSVDGGRPVTLVADLPGAAWLRGAWSDDGQIVYDTWNAGLRVVPAEGGAVRVLTQPEEEWNLGPEVIPGSTTVLFSTVSVAGFKIEAIGLDGSGRRTVLENASQPQILGSGHLLFERDGGLLVVAFDASSAKVTGPAMPLALEPMVDDERVATPVPQIAVSANGTLVYAPRQPSARAASELVSIDRQGTSEPLATVPYPSPTFDLSPDGRQLALAVRDGTRARLAIFDLARRTLTPLRDEQLDIPTAPVFSATGKEIYFARYGTHRGDILAQKLEGGEPRHLGRFEGTWIAPYSISRDGRWLVGTLFDPKTQSDIWSLDLEASDPEHAARTFAVPGDQIGPTLSPDGRWIAYETWDDGGTDVYVQRFPGGESKVRVSSGGGRSPRWSPDGRELFYLDGAGAAVLSVTVKTDPKLELGAPRKLFGGAFALDSGTGSEFEVSRDGKRFAMLLRHEDPKRASELVVVQNWFTEVSDLFRHDAR